MRRAIRMCGGLAILGALVTVGCGEGEAAVTIEPEPITAEPVDRAEPPDEETPEAVAEGARRELRAAGFAPAVPLGFESEAADGPVYDRLAELLEAIPRVTRVRIGVHSDPRGSAEYNRRVTLERARAAAAALVARGVACERIEPTGFGEDQPLPDAPMESQRRVVLSILRVDDIDMVPDDVEGADACP